MFGPQWLTILIYLFMCEHKLNYKRIFLQKLKWHNQGLCCTYSHSILFRAVPSMCSVISFQNADKEIRADGRGRDSSARQPSQQRSLLKARGRGASLCNLGKGRARGAHCAVFYRSISGEPRNVLKNIFVFSIFPTPVQRDRGCWEPREVGRSEEHQAPFMYGQEKCVGEQCHYKC